MPYTPFNPIPIQLQGSDSANLSGGSLEFYLAGTSTPTNIYSDDSGTSLGATVTLDASGYPSSGGNVVQLYRDTDIDLKVVLKSAADVTLWTADDIDQPTADMIAVLDTASNFAATSVEDALAEAKGEIAIKTAAQSKASDTTLADDSVLAGMAIAASSRYIFEALLLGTQDGGNIKFAFDISQTVTFTGLWHAVDGAGVSDEDHENFAANTVSITTLTDAQSFAIHIIGGLRNATASAATFDLQWAQETSDADNTTISANSWMRLTRAA